MSEQWPESVPWHDAESISECVTEELYAPFEDVECRAVAAREVFHRLDYSGPKTWDQIDQMRADAWNAAMRQLGYTEMHEVEV